MTCPHAWRELAEAVEDFADSTNRLEAAFEGLERAGLLTPRGLAAVRGGLTCARRWARYAIDDAERLSDWLDELDRQLEQEVGD